MNLKFTFFSTAVLALIGFTAMAQVTVSGTLTNTGGASIPVTIKVDNTVGTFNTDPAGAYSGTLTNSATQGVVSVAYTDCNGAAQLDSTFYHPGNMSITFQAMAYCTPPPACSAGFTKTQQTNGGTPVSGAVLITSTSTGSGLTYSWDFGDGSTGTGIPMSHTYTGNGPYNLCLTVTDAAGTCTDTYCDTLGVDSNGIVYKNQSQGFSIGTEAIVAAINDVEGVSSISVYPNPVTDVLNISLETVQDVSTISIVDLSGKVVFEVESVDSKNYVLDTSKWQTGIYLVNLETESNSVTQKLIVE